MDAGSPEEAIVALELNREFTPDSLELIFNLAKAYHAAERSEEAIDRVACLSPPE